MSHHTRYLFWMGEFVCYTAIAVILATTAATWVAVPAVGIVALKVFEERAFVRDHYDKIRCQLEVLEALLPRTVAQYRLTYHVPVRRLWPGGPKKLRQAFDYVPAGGGGGRTFDIQKGIIGKVFQQKGPRVENFETDEEYRARMVAEYGYTTREMGERTIDRRSYLAYPVVEGGTERVVGIFFCDSNVPRTFEIGENNAAWTAIRSAVEAMRRGLR